MGGLDDEAIRGLAELPEDVQFDIMANFAPKGTTQNVKNLFMSFLKSRTVAAGLAPGLGVKRPAAGIKRPIADVGATGPIGGNDVVAFINHWGLDQDALDALVALPEDMQLEVMATFAPKSTTQNVK